MRPFPNTHNNKQDGFTLVMAIFILVALALLGSYMMRLSGVQHTTTSDALQNTRAYQAAKAGINWAAATISKDTATNQAGCDTVNKKAVLLLAALPGFTVTVTCNLSGSYLEGSNKVYVYSISAHSEFGTYSGADYISREIEASLYNEVSPP
jgi:MSHA biogenesis protein MshP